MNATSSLPVDADRIPVREHGRVIEQGRHPLLACNGHDARMWARQQAARRAEDSADAASTGLG